MANSEKRSLPAMNAIGKKGNPESYTVIFEKKKAEKKVEDAKRDALCSPSSSGQEREEILINVPRRPVRIPAMEDLNGNYTSVFEAKKAERLQAENSPIAVHYSGYPEYKSDMKPAGEKGILVRLSKSPAALRKMQKKSKKVYKLCKQFAASFYATKISAE